ncbi:hypothetical protein FF1_037199 [Malus domestica]
MAEHLASIFGTEKDRVNCPFYFKIGACRHGDRCSRLHNRPTISPTLLLSNMYQRPDMITPGVDSQGQPLDPRKIQEHFEDFYEDIFEELTKFGEIESLHVCDNLADHMIGNVYVQFKEEDQAAAALQALQGRFYNGRPIIADFSPVTDFREATCRQFEENSCNRGGYCNFMHVKLIGRELRRRLFGRYRGYRISRSRSRSRSLSPRHRSRDYDKYDKRERDYRDRDYRGNGRRSKDRYERDRDRDGGRRRHGSSPRRSRSRSRSPVVVREGSEERRARIERWNREREEKQLRKYFLVPSMPDLPNMGPLFWSLAQLESGVASKLVVACKALVCGDTSFDEFHCECSTYITQLEYHLCITFWLESIGPAIFNVASICRCPVLVRKLKTMSERFAGLTDALVKVLLIAFLKLERKFRLFFK